MESGSTPTDPSFVIPKNHDLSLYLGARFISLCSYQMLNIALGQYIYLVTRNPLYLGYIGLTLFGPKFFLVIFAGHAADRYNRRNIILFSRVVQLLAAGLLFLLIAWGKAPLGAIYFLLFLTGAANAFDGPASHAFLPQLVTVAKFRNAVTWSSTLVQLSFIVGPPLAGWLYAFSGNARLVLGVIALLRFISVIFVSFISARPQAKVESEMSLRFLLAGIRYVFQKKVILGAITLDLFAVLLGGAVALLPIYANDIFKMGATGLGILRAAPAVGAGILAIVMLRLPSLKHAGTVLFTSVALFGIFTILFGISKNFYFSLFCLGMLGAADMVSVVIRGVLVQMKTPQEMRGRVSAVNLVFIGASNELGEFESGLTARWFGVVPAVVLGGLGTLLVVGLCSWRFPELRKYRRLEES